MKKTLRQLKNEQSEVRKDVISDEYPEIGLAAMNGPEDPKPSIRVENGRIVELDGREEKDFDSIDKFITRYGINPAAAEKYMKLSSLEIARMLVDINVPRKKLVEIAQGLTPAKLVEVVSCLNVVEIMMAQMKLRARKTPANQGHVVNIQDNPVLLAADAAEAALRGFAELETTCSVARYAPLNAISVLVGGQLGRPGIITQCSLEEATELKIGMKGFTSYAETVSVYGTEDVMTDGGDTPWSKAFLASAYASRGMKMRFSSGSGSEVMMGSAEGKSMLYLESRCMWLTKACGSQGTQNGAIDGLPIAAAMPGGFRSIAAENLIGSWLGLEVASGNDTYFSHSPARSMSKVLMQLLPGTDFVNSGYSTVPNSDSTFCGSTFDSDNYPDFYQVQRDMKVDGGIQPVADEDVVRVRREAAVVLQRLFEKLDFPEITDEEVEAAVYAYTSKDMPTRNMNEDIQCGREIMESDFNAFDIIKGLCECDYTELADSILSLLKQRLAGDYLHTSAIFDENFNVISAVNDVNDYAGPGTGYEISEERWQQMISNMNSVHPAGKAAEERPPMISIQGEAKKGTDSREVVIALSPSFGTQQQETITGISHRKVLRELCAGIEEEGMKARLVKFYASADLGLIANEGAKLSGSGISIGIQSRGTTVIHQKDLVPLDNLELFPQSPLYTEETFRRIGKNAARYAKGDNPEPIPGEINFETRHYVLRSTILHNMETELIEDRNPEEVTYE